MLYGQIKPILIKVIKYRLRYPIDIPMQKPLRVISFDMKYLLVTDEQTAKVHRVLWKDVEVIDFEKIVQVSVIQQGDQIKVKQKNKNYESLLNKASGRKND